MAARLLSALLVAILVASAHADTWQCALATDCYGCLSADPTCEWCPSSKQCASGSLTCSGSVWTNYEIDSCPCNDVSRDECSSCVTGTDCAWCDYNGEKSCTALGSCLGNWESGACIDGTKLAKWLIAVIVVSAILVVLIPILIVVICCCCCVAGTAAAVNAGERSHLVQNSTSSATVIYAQPGYAPPPAASAQAPYYPQPTYQ